MPVCRYAWTGARARSVWTAERPATKRIVAFARDVGSPLAGLQAAWRIASIVFPPFTLATLCHGLLHSQFPSPDGDVVHKNGTICIVFMR